MSAAILDFNFSQQQAKITCGACGVLFTMPEVLRAERKNDGKTWFCPNGHPRVYRESDVDALKKELADKERQLAAERERAATNFTARMKAEKELKKVKKRAACGVCPECNRTFVALGRHMKTKHPDFVAEARQ